MASVHIDLVNEVEAETADSLTSNDAENQIDNGEMDGGEFADQVESDGLMNQMENQSVVSAALSEKMKTVSVHYTYLSFQF